MSTSPMDDALSGEGSELSARENMSVESNDELGAKEKPKMDGQARACEECNR